MRYLKNFGIDEYKRKPDDPDNICLLKINGEWNEYKMVTDEFNWLEVIIPMPEGVYSVSLLDIDIMLGRLKKVIL